MCFATCLGIECGGRGGGSPKGLEHNVLMQFFTPGSSKVELSYEAHEVLKIMTTKSDHPIYVKHVLGCICVFFTLFGD